MQTEKKPSPLVLVGQANLLFARRNIGAAWKQIQQIELVFKRLDQQQKPKPLS